MTPSAASIRQKAQSPAALQIPSQGIGRTGFRWIQRTRPENPADQWFIAALQNTQAAHEVPLVDATYEAVGPHFQGNPYFLSEDKLYRHGDVAVSVSRTFDGIRSYLATHPIEGLVFWKDGEPQCKIKRSDFGLPWPAQR